MQRARLILAFIGALAPVAARPQQVAPPTVPEGGVHSCAQADDALAAIMTNGGLSALPPDSTAAPPRAMNETLFELTTLVLGNPPCAAALAVRGVFKWRLVGSHVAPRDALGQRPGTSWAEDAVRDFATAAREGRDGAGGSDAAVLAAEALLQGGLKSQGMVDEVAGGLIAALARPGRADDSTRALVRGRLARWVWQPAVADSAFDAYRVAGGNAGMAALELARIRLATGDARGDSLYYQAAASGDSAVRAELIADIALIADSAALDTLVDTLDTRNRPDRLRQFWETRDVRSLRERGSRLREHYRRIGYALAHYRLRTYPRRYETFELWRNPRAPFDDRGLIYVRHGPPDESATAIAVSPPESEDAVPADEPDSKQIAITVPDPMLDISNGRLRTTICPNVSWLYRRPEGNLVFHFSARDDISDWRLVETLYNVEGRNGSATNRLRRSYEACAPIEGLFASRVNIDPIYGKLAFRPSPMDDQEELKLTTRSRKVGTTTDSYELRFAHPLSATLQTYGLFGASARSARVLTVVAVPVGQLPLGPDSVADIRLRLVATAGSVVVEADTTRRLRIHGDPGALVLLAEELPLRSGAWDLGLVISDEGSTGQYFRQSDVVVPAESGLSLSDIVLAQEQDGLPWMGRDGVVSLNALGAYAQGHPIVLYYEEAGDASSRTTHITIRDEHNTVTLAFTERPGAGVVAVRRNVDTHGLRPGPLTITVAVTDGAGHTAARTVHARLTPQPRTPVRSPK